jgi:HlyD family secretion protein
MKKYCLIITALLGLSLAACDNTETTYMVGTLERDRVELKVETNEPIVSIHVADGQAVLPGDLVLEQDPARAAAHLARLEAQRDQAAARLAELVRGPREESIREARANLSGARAERSNAASDLERTREVFERGLSSADRMDAAETRFETAVAREQAANEALDRLLNGTTVEELRQAESAVESARAQVRAARVDLDRTRVAAPSAGIIDKVLYQLGERPAPGSTIAVLLSNDRVFARVYVPEHLRARVTPGRSIDVRVDGVEGVLDGTVRWVSADATFTPYFALTEHDRSRLSYLAEIDVPGAADLPSGVPLEVNFPGE